MRAEQLLTRLEGVRARGDGRWLARCPAHEDRSPSLTIRQASDKILIFCWASCSPIEICSAIGLSLADLYDDHRSGSEDIDAERRRSATEGLKRWTERKLLDVCGILRNVDWIIRNADAGLRVCIALGRQECEVAESLWLDLAFAYRLRTGLEYDFARLNSRNPADHLAVYRDHNGASPQ